MNHYSEFIVVPLATWLSVCGGLFAFLLTTVGFWAFNKHSTNVKNGTVKERDWSIPAVDRFKNLDSPFHSWDPRVKIASLVVYWFCIAALNQIFLIGVVLIISLIVVTIAKVPIRAAMKRIAALSGFVGMFMIVMPLTVKAKQGDLIFVLDPLSFLQFNLRGFFLALKIGGKASAIALMMDPVFATSSFPVTMEGLAGLGVPRKICEMLMLVHRYIFVFQHEARRMMTGMRLRGFRAGTNMATLSNTGNFLGMLFVRSFERTEGVYESMLARGYQGRFPGHPEMHLSSKDWLKGTFWVSFGLCLVVLEHFILIDSWF